MTPQPLERRLATRVGLAITGVVLLIVGVFAWIQVASIAVGVLRQAWIVRLSAWSVTSTLASLATPFIGAHLLRRAWRPRLALSESKN